jgi:hypothetical protein
MEGVVVDCTKPLSDLTLSEGVQCFLQSNDWTIIAENSRRMWSWLVSDWNTILVMLFLLLPLYATVAFPIFFIYLFIHRYGYKRPMVFDGKENRRKNFWGIYLILAGVVYAAISDGERALQLVSGVMTITGVMILWLGPAWWGELSTAYPVPPAAPNKRGWATEENAHPPP